MCSRQREPRFSLSATCCRWFTSCGRCATASLPPTTRGMRQAWSGQFRRLRRPSILTSNRSSPGKPTTTTRSRGRSQLHSSPVATVNHETHENSAHLHHFATAEQQKDAASFGMWLFLVTEVMFFGGMFCAYLVY